MSNRQGRKHRDLMEPGHQSQTLASGTHPQRSAQVISSNPPIHQTIEYSRFLSLI